jgi:hypothetical protein
MHSARRWRGPRPRPAQRTWRWRPSSAGPRSARLGVGAARRAGGGSAPAHGRRRGNSGSPAQRRRRGATAMGEQRVRRSGRHGDGPGDGAVGEAGCQKVSGASEAVWRRAARARRRSGRVARARRLSGAARRGRGRCQDAWRAVPKVSLSRSVGAARGGHVAAARCRAGPARRLKGGARSSVISELKFNPKKISSK